MKHVARSNAHRRKLPPRVPEQYELPRLYRLLLSSDITLPEWNLDPKDYPNSRRLARLCCQRTTIVILAVLDRMALPYTLPARMRTPVTCVYT